MNILTIIGACMLLFGALLLCYCAGHYYDKVSAIYAEILRFLLSLRQKVKTSTLSIDQILSSERDYRELDSLSFFEYAREHSVGEAFSNCADRLPIDKEDKLALGQFFVNFGSDMLSVELENLDIIIDSIESKYARVKDDNKSKKRIASTMIVCLAMMLIILII